MDRELKLFGMAMENALSRAQTEGVHALARLSQDEVKAVIRMLTAGDALARQIREGATIAEKVSALKAWAEATRG